MKLLLCLLLALPWCACTTRSKAKAQAQAAFFAGQRQAIIEMQAQRTSIRVIGPAKHPEIAWAEDLTLAQVIATADLAFQHDPRAIYITRQGRRIPVDPKTLLEGKDMPMQPGDIVEVEP